MQYRSCMDRRGRPPKQRGPSLCSFTWSVQDPIEAPGARALPRPLELAARGGGSSTSGGPLGHCTALEDHLLVSLGMVNKHEYNHCKSIEFLMWSEVAVCSQKQMRDHTGTRPGDIRRRPKAARLQRRAAEGAGCRCIGVPLPVVLCGREAQDFIFFCLQGKESCSLLWGCLEDVCPFFL